ncbi:Glyoxalase/Bleomycin resistance protein/Dioxygenase superfamily protein [Sinosporangium album]|uniref:Glyoxalase/Bleomycin resistance protein/Dioxygenase superfamily protein n=1 Tax=Sinosporangium album TaxID=504805 RepID=A0A1G8E4G8_9ACTN|nr:VOC family protein [Sinosporangium album]SDH64539.1 Glyoxalase/Bleomycin resistance protein/Dioxygenase superfamily protein [Sinosporangium album]
MPTIERLAHVGIHVRDMERSLAFYKDVLGLQITDDDREHGMIFLSSRPEIEHHEVLLCGGRTVGDGELWLQQISFRCSTLEDVLGFYRRFVENDVKIEYTVTHGNAIGVYFYDPDGNRCEVYWPTGLEAKQGFLEGLDLTRPAEELVEQVRASVEKYGKTGYVDTRLLEGIDVDK